MRPRVRSMSWSGTTMCSGSMSSRRLPTALTLMMNSTPRLFSAQMLARAGSSDGQDAVADAVPREEGDALPVERADGDRVAGRAVRRVDAQLLDVGEAFHLVEAAAADDGSTDAAQPRAATSAVAQTARRTRSYGRARRRSR